MKLIDEKGNEWLSYPPGPYAESATFYRRKPTPKVIDWSNVHPDVPVKSSWKKIAFRSKTTPYYPGDTLVTGKWVAWFGGDKPPVPEGVTVEVVYRCGHKEESCPTMFCWSHSRYFGQENDIIAFKIKGLKDGYAYSEG